MRKSPNLDGQDLAMRFLPHTQFRTARTKQSPGAFIHRPLHSPSSPAPDGRLTARASDPPLADTASPRDTGDSFPDKFGHSTGNHYLRRYNSPARGIDRHGLRWWNGRHEGLKILWPFGCAGSSPARSTKQQDNTQGCLAVFISYRYETFR